MGNTAISLIKSGKISMTVIDDKVKRILRVMYKTQMLGGAKRTLGAYNTAEHQQTALKIGEEGIVLLKNDDHVPLGDFLRKFPNDKN
jgi:beta-glucosidase